LMDARINAQGVADLGNGLAMPLTERQRSKAAGYSNVVLGVRAHSLRLSSQGNDFAVGATVDLSEISGSETYVHLHRGELSLVAQLTGVHTLDIGAATTVYFLPDDVFIFSPDGALLCAPDSTGA
jgi:glycerol transport system ATP-binding protein